MTQPTIRAEFEKAFNDRYYTVKTARMDAALWAIQWITEKCAQEAESIIPHHRECADKAAGKIRKLAKDLGA